MADSRETTGRGTGQEAVRDVDPKASVIGELHEVRASFDSSDRMADAVERLLNAGFDRADLSLPEPSPAYEQQTPESGARPADTEEDARQARTLHTSGAASVAALAAAGLTIGTGGAIAPAIGAALGAAALVGGATYAATKATDSQEQHLRDADAAAGRLLLSVRLPNESRRGAAEAVLRAAGATHIGAE